MKRFLLKFADIILGPFIFLSAMLLLKVRKSGLYKMGLTKIILNRIGVFPIIDNFYEPLFNTERLKKSLEEERCLPGIEFNEKEQLETLRKFTFNEELKRIPFEKVDNDLRFFYNNGFFEQGDAEYLYNMIRLIKPKSIIEIGSGYSTLMAMNAVKMNTQESSKNFCKYTCIDPFARPSFGMLELDLIQKKIEDVDKGIFKELTADSILFIDSTHIIKPQGDVLFEYLEILPILKAGVIIQIHDIFTPRDYLNSWLIDEKRFWNEQYLLEAFLTFNGSYKITGALNYLKHNYFKELSEKCPVFKKAPQVEPGSFWMRKL